MVVDTLYIVINVYFGEFQSTELVFEDKQQAEDWAGKDGFDQVHEVRLVRKGEPAYPEVD